MKKFLSLLALLVCFTGCSLYNDQSEGEYKHFIESDFVNFSAIQEFQYNEHDYIKFIDAMDIVGQEYHFVVLHSPDCKKCADRMKD